MKKRIFEENVGGIEGEEIKESLDEFIKQIQSFKDKGATHIYPITCYNKSSGDTYLALNFYRNREETDEEYEKRIKREKEREKEKADKIRQLKMEELKSLKKRITEVEQELYEVTIGE